MSGGGGTLGLPLRYLVTASGAFVLAAVAVPWLAGELAGHYYHPRLLALVHTVALGWITLSIVGATHQLVPAALERPIWSERLARWQFPMLAVGIVGMVAHFWIAEWAGLLWAAGLVALGGLSHLVNVGLSLRPPASSTSPRWSFTARGFALGLGGLGLTIALGLALAANRIAGFLPLDPLTAVAAHFHLALLGWVAPVILGVAARTYPMFLVAPEPKGWPVPLQTWGLGLGVPTLVAGLLAVWPPAVAAGALTVTAALAAHVGGVVVMVRARKRPALDTSLRFVLTGTAYLVAALGLGLALATGAVGGPHAALAYGVLALGGWVSLTIVGMLLRIVPTLAWSRAFAARAGRAPVPPVTQLAWPAMERLCYLGLAPAPLALAVAVAAGRPEWIRAAGLLLGAGAAAFGAFLVRVFAQVAPGGRRVPVASAGARA